MVVTLGTHLEPLLIDEQSGDAIVRGRQVELTGMQRKLLRLLWDGRGTVLSPWVIYHELWGKKDGRPEKDSRPSNFKNKVQNLVFQLRQRLDAFGEATLIEMVEGSGYRLRARLPAPLLRPFGQRPHLFGRDHERADLRALLLGSGQGAKRLVTLLGPPGVGKTSLAQQVAADLRREFPQGTEYVSLEFVRDPFIVLPAIVKQLRLQPRRDSELLDCLMDHLRHRQMLLVLDNFEQVVEAAPLVGALISGCPDLSLLVTSRTPLGVDGEQRFPVMALRLPDLSQPGPPPSPDILLHSPAVELFVDRACADEPRIRKDLEANARLVAEICARLEGLPLAIVLAASRVGDHSLGEIRQGLEHQLEFLELGSRARNGRPDRQGSLRAEIDWSYRLLSPEEQVLYRRLAVFSGGWTHEMVNAICADAPEGQDGWVPSKVLRELKAHSLVERVGLVDALGQSRFSMLVSLRDYAAERLAESGERDKMLARLAVYCERLVERTQASLGQRLEETEHAQSLARLEQEQDNIRVVLRWAIEERGDSELALRVAGGMAWFWGAWGQVTEGRVWLNKALALPAPPATPERSWVRASALGELANFASEQGDWNESEALHRQALDLWRELAVPLGVAARNEGLGMLRMKQNDPAAAAAFFEQCLHLCESNGTERHSSHAHYLLGTARLHLGQLEEARRLAEKAKAMDTKLGNWAGVSNALMTLGALSEERGDYVAALASYQESLTVRERLGHRAEAAKARLYVAEVLALQDEIGQAWSHYAKSLPVLETQGDRLSAARGLEGLALLAATLGWHEKAHRFAGAGAALRGVALTDQQGRLSRRLGAALIVARRALGAACSDRAFEEGKLLSLARAIEQAEAAFGVSDGK